MDWRKLISAVMLVSLLAATAAGCVQSGNTTPAAQEIPAAEEQTTRPEGWTDETHGNDAAPDYSVVFPQDKVNQLKITVAPEDWEAMQANMTELYGAPGTGQPGGGMFPGMSVLPEIEGELPGFTRQLPADGALPATGNFSRRGWPLPGTGNMTRASRFPPGTDNVTGMPEPLPGADDLPRENLRRDVPGWADMTPENPAWVPASIDFNGLTWTNVGFRYKGNSSLTSSWRQGADKLPFKLDFDEFEDEYPETDNQRFYGFKQLSFSNAFADAAYMRDTLAADILAEAGLAAAETAYYEVIIDHGEGEVSLGLYVMIEVIDDTVIERCFGDDDGNIYEGDGRGVSLAQGTYNQLQNSYLKENNEDEADWSDIEELYSVLHSEQRTSAPEAWRASLEEVFDVDVFLEWLAIDAIIQHWDTYGAMTHNFYLYHDPETDLLTWISWDHNQVLAGGGMGGSRVGRALPGIRSRTSLSLGREEVTEQWPLIRYLLDDPVYHERYINYLKETVEGPFNPGKLAEQCRELAEIIAPYAAQESGEAAFETAVEQLIDRVYERYEATRAFLAGEEPG